MDTGKFERLTNHILPNGETDDIPIYLDKFNGLDENSILLMHIANLIGSNLDFYNLSIDEVCEQIKNVLDGDSKSVVYESQSSSLAVLVEQENTSVNFNSQGKQVIPTAVVYNLFSDWQTYLKDKTTVESKSVVYENPSSNLAVLVEQDSQVSDQNRKKNDIPETAVFGIECLAPIDT